MKYRNVEDKPLYKVKNAGNFHHEIFLDFVDKIVYILKIQYLFTKT